MKGNLVFLYTGLISIGCFVSQPFGFATDVASPAVKLRIDQNQLQMKANAEQPFYIQWRYPSGEWHNWNSATIIPSDMESIWFRGVFETDNPLDWDIPSDVDSIYSSSSDFIIEKENGWVSIGQLEEETTVSLAPLDWISVEAEAIAASLPLAEATANNHAMATPDPGKVRLFMQSDVGLTVSWILTDEGAKKSGILCYPTAIGDGWKVVAVGDINLDGIDDLVMMRMSDGTLIYWMLEADGYKRSGGVIGPAVGANWKVEAYGDIDQDGVMDLVMRRQSDGMNIYWMLNSDGTKKSGGIISDAVGDNWKIEAFGDINLDGVMDLVMRRQTDGMNIYWMLNSDGTKKSGGIISDAIGSNWRIEAHGDINRDGVMDLIMRRQTDGVIIYWMLNSDGTKMSGGVVSDAVGATWSVKGASDIDNDGTTDLIIARYDNLLIYWLLNPDGTKKSGGLVQSGAIGSNWDIQSVVSY